MNLGLLVLFLPQICLGIGNEYTGFNRCWENGWECRNYKGDLIRNDDWEAIFEVTYNCGNYTRTGRVWIWTARLPDTTHKFTVANCDHIELHTDCTKSYRLTKIQEFRAININHLEFLDISRGYLHDSGDYHHLPPLLHLEDIRNMTLVKDTLKISKNENCLYNSDFMKRIVMKRVTIEKLEATSATGEFDIFWSGVTVKEIDSNAVYIKGNVTIENSYFPKVKTNAMSFQGENVVLRGNTFDTLNEASINVKSFRFNFTENKMKAITKNGLKIESSQVNIDRNHIGHLDNTAFGDISPYYYSNQGNYALSYSFTGNEIEILSPFSLHCNWNKYEKTCTNFIISDNKFHCTCYNLVWLNAFQERTVTENAGFYGILLNTTHHCGTSVNCSLSEIIKFICHNASSIESQCGGFREKEIIDVPTEETTLYMNSGADTSPSNVKEGTESSREISRKYETTGGERKLVPFEGNKGSEKYTVTDTRYSQDTDSNGMILNGGYYTDHTVSSQATAHYFPLWLIAIVAVGLIGLTASVFVAWYFRRRRNQRFIQIYKYDKSKDSDGLILGTRIDGDNSSNNIFSD